MYLYQHKIYIYCHHIPTKCTTEGPFFILAIAESTRNHPKQLFFISAKTDPKRYFQFRRKLIPKLSNPWKYAYKISAKNRNRICFGRTLLQLFHVQNKFNFRFDVSKEKTVYEYIHTQAQCSALVIRPSINSVEL